MSLNNVLLNSVQGRKSESTLQSRLSEFDGTKGRSINESLEYSGITPYKTSVKHNRPENLRSEWFCIANKIYEAKINQCLRNLQGP